MRSRVTSELNIFDKVHIEVSGKLFPNIFVKFIDANVDMCLSAEQARMLGEVLLLRANALDAEIAAVCRPARPSTAPAQQKYDDEVYP